MSFNTAPPQEPARPVQERPAPNSNPSTTISDLLQQQVQNADTESRSDSSSVNSASQSNVQINNNSNRIAVDGIKIPETTLSISAYGNENDLGGILTVNIPIGGKSRKSARRNLNLRNQQRNLAFQADYASACANIADGGFVVTKNATTLSLLSNCDAEINKKVKLVARHEPQVIKTSNPEVDLLRKQNAELRLLVEQLLEKNNTPVKGGY